MGLGRSRGRGAGRGRCRAADRRLLGRAAAVATLLLAGAGIVAAPVGAGADAGGSAPSRAQAYPPFVSPPAVEPPACRATSRSPDAVPAGQVQSVEHQVTAFAGTHFEGIGQCGGGLILMTLTDGSEAVAKQVRARFGPAVQIMVGMTVWNGAPGRSPTCGTLVDGERWPSGVSAILTLERRTVGVGGALRASVRFADGGDRTFTVDTVQPVGVVVLRRGTRRVVGVGDVPVAGTGYGTVLRPGGSASVDAVGGTGRCDGGLGSALPPGRYTAIAEISGPGVTGRGTPIRFTTEVPVRVVAGR